MYKKILWTIALVSSLLFSQNILANHWGCGEGMQKIMAGLNLDDAQKAKLKPIMDQLKSGMMTMGTQMDALDKQIDAQVNSDKMDANALNGLVDQKAKLIADAMKAKLMAKNQIMAILTPEQKATMQSKMQAMKDKIAAHFKSCQDQD
ncbi:Spy/CpxP family protein refolding chaperone [Legionella sp. CNM-4043-24]|uniref:Spy/CpxP family protein refolding chaperone n=1 Tax=Legionella sp. CNM-4043-24 TaxID=3421646 RepID=UPI00403AA9D9